MPTSSAPYFIHQPIAVFDGISVFSADDLYTDNYKQIAIDHILAMKPDSDNPFIENALWAELEESTRLLIKKYVPVNARVLDVGVGLGRVMSELPQFQRYGIDISLEYLKIAREKGIEVAFSRIEDMPYNSHAFDAVVTCDVLEHVVEFDVCIKQILRVLKPEGHLIVRVPYKEDLKVYLQEGLPYEFIHLRNFDEHSIRLYFEKISRCKVLETSLVAPYWQGETRMRYRMPTSLSPLNQLLADDTLVKLGIDEEGKEILHRLTGIPEERIVAWINRIKQEAPALFDKLKTHLILDIEMNVVIRNDSH
jgi:SAM-dependent methyltransferase